MASVSHILRRLRMVATAVLLLLTPLAFAAPVSHAGGQPPAGATPPSIGGQFPQNADWAYYGNDPGAMRYVNADNVNASNVSQLKPVWVFRTGVTNSSSLSFESQPIEVGGMLYFTSGEDHVYAVDATSGKLKWYYKPDLPPLDNMAICCGVANRGPAVGGGRVYVAQLDDNLVALDQSTGKLLWKTQVEDYRQAYTMTMAPLYYNNMVIVGLSGGEFQVRGRVEAFNATTGAHLWTTYTVPGTGQPNNDTWQGTSWKNGSAPVWDSPTVDPSLNMIYFSTGNAGPDISGANRAGKNLYAASVLALDASTGKIAWYFQEVHHDIWDYDGPQMTSLYTVQKNGQEIPAIGHANKDGWYFILDRRNGNPLSPVKEVSVPTNPSWQNAWPTQPESISLEPQNIMPSQGSLSGPTAPQFTPPSENATWIQPGYETGPEWVPAAFSPRTHYAYVPSGGYDPWQYQAQPNTNNTQGSGATTAAGVAGKYFGLFDAVDTTTNQVIWQIKTPYKALSGLTVAGNLLFFGQSSGAMNAADATTGKILWHYIPDVQGMGGANGNPTIYVRNGREYIVMAFGGNFRERADYQTANSYLSDELVAFALPQQGQENASPMMTSMPLYVIPTGAPEGFPTIKKPTPGAHVIDITLRDHVMTPNTFTVNAGELVDLKLTETGVTTDKVALNVGPLAITQANSVSPGETVYFEFVAPENPGKYDVFGPGDLKYNGLRGTMTVNPSSTNILMPVTYQGAPLTGQHPQMPSNP